MKVSQLTVQWQCGCHWEGYSPLESPQSVMGRAYPVIIAACAAHDRGDFDLRPIQLPAFRAILGELGNEVWTVLEVPA